MAKLVFIPAPAVGHVMSTIEMAKLLVNRDQRLSVNVLLINPPIPISAFTAYIESLAKNPIERIRFIELPQVQTPLKIDPNAFLSSFYELFKGNCQNVRNIVADMINQPGSTRLVGFVVDVFFASMIDVADEFNVPTYVFYTSNAAFLGFNLYLETLCVDKNQDVIDQLVSNSEGELHELIVLSFVNPVPMKAFPTEYQTQDGLDFLVCSFRDLRKVKGVMVNTFLELETHAIKSFPDTNFPPEYPVGPILNLDGVAGKADDMDVIRWLDGQPPSSVVVLCFESMGIFNEVQVKEIARGLEQSGHRFVWSLRRAPSLEKSSKGLDDNYDGVLPDGFLERTMGVGKVIGWAPQVSLLAHQAVGGFVSHCGWNSILESIWFGVPTATWPMYAEQKLNAFEMVVELGLAVDLKLNYKIDMFNPSANTVIVTAEEIERGIKRVMEDNKVRAKVIEMSKLSRATMAEGGSSYASVGYLVKEIMSNI
ncbi:anthocyanidin 3-O-glucosyltransferase 2-like isoform X1 [Bidens hawaiensis]|uniref:anthocyanidin 3-O-glucosyltransferase 2-like isoform X1 n=1 Tax=Bidens hawaiensis TaxID=980011 RepID=UPI004048F3E7